MNVRHDERIERGCDFNMIEVETLMKRIDEFQTWQVREDLRLHFRGLFLNFT